ncbi:MAG: response regulator [Thiotrichaceae bacterium]|nr:response regulator [Thiotrichaceae bacterium]
MIKVLVVEDDAVMQIVVSETLESFGFQAIACDDGEQAWQMLQTAPEINIVITDWLMPRLSGIELCRRIRTQLKVPYYVYTIILTSKGDKNAFMEGMEAGADDFLIKPFDSEELRMRLNVATRILAREQMLAERNQTLQLAQQRTNQDLKIAAQLQRSLLPKAKTLGENLRFEWLFHPSRFVSGDCFNFFELNSDYVCFYQIDVAGEGVSSALLSFGLYHHLNRRELLWGEGKPLAPAQVLRNLAQDFQQTLHEKLHFAIIYGYAQKSSKTLCFSRAGHSSPIHLDSSTGALSLCGDNSQDIGALAAEEFTDTQVSFKSGDRLFIYSRGLGQVMRQAKMLQFLQKARSKPLHEVIKQVGMALESKRGQGGFNEDISFLTLESQ